ncbi:MAG: BatD family protein [Gammaproteobacteria bacterium]|nr:BatD family protein [Gammaproteobacteria bacterium]MDH5801714.1 BatD family protein [Gammaproteobacteria bacterium]
MQGSIQGLFARLWPAVFYIFVMYFAATVTGTAYAAISVSVDRATISQDESFYLEFSSDSNVDDDPDFSPLNKDFHIVNQSNSSSMRIINGRVSRESTWSLMLMAKRAGNLVIPSIRFGSDKSPQKRITIKKSVKSNGEKGTSALYIEAETNTKNLYVQSQLLYTVRIYSAINLMKLALPEPNISAGEAIIEKFDTDASYEKRIKGRRYKIFEKRYAIFPQKSGTLVIDGTQFTAQYVDNRRALRTKVLNTDPINISVKPKPALPALKNKPWLPAEKIQIKEEWPDDPPQFSVGTPVTRTLTIVAGGLTSAQLPQLQTDMPKTMKLYPDKPSLQDNKSTEGIIGIRQEKTAFIPTREGEFRLEAIEIPWWNTREDRLETAVVPARTVLVRPAPAMEPAAGSGIAELGQAPTPQSTSSTTAPSADAGWWRWLAIGSTLGWIMTIVLLWYRKPAPVVETRASIPPAAGFKVNHTAMRELDKACRANDALAAKNALLSLGKSLFPDNPPTSLGELAKLSDGSDGGGGEVAQQIRLLNQSIYSEESGSWQSEALLAAIKRFKPSMQPNQGGQEKNVILPLHISVNNGNRA